VGSEFCVLWIITITLHSHLNVQTYRCTRVSCEKTAGPSKTLPDPSRLMGASVLSLDTVFYLHTQGSAPESVPSASVSSVWW